MCILTEYKTESNGKFRTVDLISEIIISLIGLCKGMERTKERLKTDWDKLSNLKNREQSPLEKKRTKMQAPVGQYEEVWPVKMKSQKVGQRLRQKNFEEIIAKPKFGKRQKFTKSSSVENKQDKHKVMLRHIITELLQIKGKEKVL